MPGSITAFVSRRYRMLLWGKFPSLFFSEKREQERMHTPITMVAWEMPPHRSAFCTLRIFEKISEEFFGGCVPSQMFHAAQPPDTPLLRHLSIAFDRWHRSNLLLFTHVWSSLCLHLGFERPRAFRRFCGAVVEVSDALCCSLVNQVNTWRLKENRPDPPATPYAYQVPGIRYKQEKGFVLAPERQKTPGGIFSDIGLV